MAAAAASCGSGRAGDGVAARSCATAIARIQAELGGHARASRRRSRRRRRHAAAAARGCPTSTAPTSPFVTIDPRVGDATSTRRCTSSATATATSSTTRSPTSPRSSRPGDPVDVEAHRRGETLYGADSKIPLHPTVISEGAASLLPDQVRPALLWTIQVDDDRRGHRRRRSSGRGCGPRAKLDYDGVAAAIDDGSADRVADAAQGGRRAAAGPRGRPRRGVAAAARAGGRRSTATTGAWSSGALLPVEQWNAQISLLTGMAAASLMVYARVGPAPHPAAAGPARRPAAAPHRPRAGHRLAGRDALPRLHPVPRPEQARPTPRWSWRAPGCCAAAGTSPSTASCPSRPQHSALASEYAHVTAPLRRLGDRYAGEVCLALCAGTTCRAGCSTGCPSCPSTMQRSGQRAHRYERAVLDLVEAGVLRAAGRREVRGRRRRRRRQGRQARHHHRPGPRHRGTAHRRRAGAAGQRGDRHLVRGRPRVAQRGLHPGPSAG